MGSNQQGTEAYNNQSTKKRQHRDITKIVPKHKEQLILHCEWNDCTIVLAEIMDFIKHVGCHLRQPESATSNEKGIPIYKKMWTACCFSPVKVQLQCFDNSWFIVILFLSCSFPRQ